MFQAGKSSCDRMAAVIKRKLRTYLDSGHDIVAPRDFILAMQQTTKINGMKFFHAEVKYPENHHSQPKPSITKITSLNDFTFNGGGIKAKRYTGIGTGIEIEEKNWKGKASATWLNIFSYYPITSFLWTTWATDWSPVHCTRHIVNRRTATGERAAEQDCEMREPESNEQQTCPENEPSLESEIIADNIPPEKIQEEQKIFDCSEPNCIAQFSKFGNLQRHIMIGKHKFAVERMTMRDHALHLFQSNNAGGGEYRIQLRGPLEDIAKDLKLIEGTPFRQMEQGWAMKQKRTHVIFSEKQKVYLNAAFARGVNKRHEKVNAKQLAKQMEEELVPGTTNHRFFPNEMLTAKQIANYFGIKARRMREQQPECFNEPNAAACSTIDGQHTTSEGEEEREHAEDPMFIRVEDELIEIVQELDIIEKQSPPTTTDAPPITLTTILTEHKHNNRHEHKKHDELLIS